ncbi:MAG: endonuclease III [Bacilli bacterium]|nr:endonuclease III [Bacilli bacterium]
MNKINNILKYLDEIIPNPICELNYNKDYELLIAVVLSAQTTDREVNKVTSVLFNKYSSLNTLKTAPVEDLIEILRPIGMNHKKALFVKQIAADLIDLYDGKVINDRKVLESLSGVGRKTASVVMTELFNEPYIAVDTHVARVSKRLGLVLEKDNVLTIENKLTKLIDSDKLARAHYQLILFGRYYCTSPKPNCINCKLNKICKYEKKTLLNSVFYTPGSSGFVSSSMIFIVLVYASAFSL